MRVKSLGALLTTLILLSINPTPPPPSHEKVVLTAFPASLSVSGPAMAESTTCAQAVSRDGVFTLAKALEPGESGGIQVICALSRDGPVVISEVRILITKDANSQARPWKTPSGPPIAVH